MSAVVDPGKGYRLLAMREILRGTDEYLWDDSEYGHSWQPAGGQEAVGDPIDDGFLPVRRKARTDGAPVGYRWADEGERVHHRLSRKGEVKLIPYSTIILTEDCANEFLKPYQEDPRRHPKCIQCNKPVLPEHKNICPPDSNYANHACCSHPEGWGECEVCGEVITDNYFYIESLPPEMCVPRKRHTMCEAIPNLQMEPVAKDPSESAWKFIDRVYAKLERNYKELKLGTKSHSNPHPEQPNVQEWPEDTRTDLEKMIAGDMEDVYKKHNEKMRNHTYYDDNATPDEYEDYHDTANSIVTPEMATTIGVPKPFEVGCQEQWGSEFELSDEELREWRKKHG